MTQHDDEADRVPPVPQHPVGSGLDQNLMSPFLREGPRRTPASVRTLLMEGVPFLVLAGVVIFFASR